MHSGTHCILRRCVTSPPHFSKSGKLMKTRFPALPLNLSHTTKFYSSKLTGFADDNFEMEEYGRKFSKRVVNTVGKEKLLLTSNFSFFHSVFKRAFFSDTLKQGLVREQVYINLRESTERSD